MRRHITFDLDGTLVDTAPDLIRVLNAVIAEDGLGTTDYAEARKLIGYGSRRMIEAAFGRAGRGTTPARLDALRDRFLDLYPRDIARESVPFPGVLDTLVDMQRDGYVLTVCTNKPGDMARKLLGELGMSALFERIVGGDDLPRNKPHSDHVFRAVGHRRNRDIVMVGDGAPDSLAARNAAVPCILMRYGYSPDPLETLKADVIADSFREVPEIISRF